MKKADQLQDPSKKKNKRYSGRNSPTIKADAKKRDTEEDEPNSLKHMKVIEKYIQLEKKFGIKSKSIGNSIFLCMIYYVLFTSQLFKFPINKK